MVGTVVFQAGDYVETITRYSNPVSLVECKQGNHVTLYRIEWIDFTGENLHKVAYSPEIANNIYQDKCSRYCK